MKTRYIFAAFALTVCTILPIQPVRAEAIEPNSLLIAVVQTGQEGAAGHDLVVLHNTTAESLDVTGWKLQYRAANAVGTAIWATKRAIACTIAAPGCTISVPARSNLVLATYDIAGIDRQPLASGFSDTGGQLRVVRPGASANQVEVLDMVGFGNAAEAEGVPVGAPKVGQAIVRKQDAHQKLIDTGNNAADFQAGCYVPTLSEVPAITACEDPPVETPDTDTPPMTNEPVTPPANEPDHPAPHPTLFITEILPDPESPATDSADEFIELYNPHPHPVEAKDYVLQTGAEFRYQYTLSDVVIPAGGFVAVYSAESHLSLSNSGTAVRLVDPNGIVVDTLANYGQAKSGQSWAKGAHSWQWTLTPTPSAQNVFNSEAPKAVLAAATAAKRAAATKKATATAKTTKATAAPKAVKPAASTAASAQAAAIKPQDSGTVQYWVLGGIGALILAYALYEYRQDIARFGRKIWAYIRRKKQPQQNAAKQQSATLQTD